MTENQKALVTDFFNGGYSFGSWPNPRDIGREFRIRDFLMNPENIHEINKIAAYDKGAEETIEQCRKAIETLTAYRLALSERYNELATAPVVPVVKLIREKRYHQNVFYHLITCNRNLDSGKDTGESRTTYEGSERHKAIKDFEAYCKSHPGIIAVKQIEKSIWE